MKPEFLKKIDNYLLVNYPVLWQSRILWVGTYSLALFALFYFFGDRFDYEPYENGEFSYYYHERQDRVMFGILPLFLSILTLFYWLYTQYQQKIDYSKLSLGGFTATTLLNFACVVLLFLPAIGLAYSTLDFPRNLENTWLGIQTVVTLATAASILPFILRQYTIIETVLVIFFGFVYCIGVALVFAGILEVKGDSVMVTIFVINYLAFLGYVLVKFAKREITQNLKRLALLCVLALPLVVPAFTYYAGYYNYRIERAYEYALGFKGDPFTLKWMVLHVVTVLTTYSLLAYFMYRSMVFPVKRK
ncbi:hypothetical protein [uncultured Microscilla sp.]|uniref:hypothetical protein n=1 Tax=uncultured Microscilla sp. TaxID=432653 RepID=UPI00260D10A9|nr:hypothetical protein [uncultured Microscilla sp.]